MYALEYSGLRIFGTFKARAIVDGAKEIHRPLTKALRQFSALESKMVLSKFA